MDFTPIDAHMRSPHIPNQTLPQNRRPDVGSYIYEGLMYGARSFAYASEAVHNALQPPVARRPLSRLYNHLFDVRITHNSAPDIALHIIFVSFCSNMVGSCLGVALGLTEAAVQLIAVVVAMTWYLTEDDGIFNI